ncbi:MAG: FKBP-type peptidyl-prolyl cis-trans isomerase [Parachlamydiaceae bacterium]|nr:FKBP-type peptidyl-prolyl cis-trans isomerase [Parachlamydiaceae bacterium]
MGANLKDAAKDAALDMKKVSEAFGHFIGRHLKSPGMDFDLDGVIKGIRDGSDGKVAPMSDKEYEKMMLMVQKNAIEKTSSENLKAANEYIQKNSKNSGMIEVQPGKLYYQVVKEGNGEVVGTHATPQITYSGQFIDGTVFGSSDETGPVSIPLDQTIPGFSLGIAGMKEGEKRRLIIHPELGYGMTGHLPPNSLLIFEIEVVKANTAEISDSGSDEDEDDFSPLALAGDDKDKMRDKGSNNYFDEDDEDDDEDDNDDEDDDNDEDDNDDDDLKSKY